MSARRTLLVVEDDTSVREMLEAVLTLAGYHVVAVGEAPRAAETARLVQPDLVLCDIAMPDLDGYGVLRELQEEPSTSGIPVVFLTARREFTERVKAFRYGVVDYLMKPITPDALVTKVQRLLDSLDRRTGVVRETLTAEGTDLIDELQRAARSGVLTVARSGEPVVRALVERGAIVDGTSPVLLAEDVVEFEELEPPPETVRRDPGSLPSEGSLPRLDELPPSMRVVLVADDNLQFRRFLADVLGAQGLTVLEADNGNDALRIALERRPWLVLSDVRMEGADGLELCRQVRRHTLLRHTPFIFLSGWDDYADRYEGLQAGANEFLSKQTPVRELLLRIQLLMKRFADLQGRDRRGSSMHGRLGAVSAAAVLQMCHLAGLSGVLTVRDGERRAALGFHEGRVVVADSDVRRGEAAVYDMLGWSRGTFDFQPSEDPGAGTPVDKEVEHLLLEGCRLVDEARGATL